MALLYSIHPENPQVRLLRQAAALLRSGGILAVPTDTSYALAGQLDDKATADRIREIRALDKQQPLSLACRDLAELASYARVDNAQFRLLKLGTPGPYTFILPASREVPRRLSHPRRKTIGLRVPAHRVFALLLAEHGAPLLVSTLKLAGDTAPLADAVEIRDRVGHQIAAVLDCGGCPNEPSTVVDLTGSTPEIIRRGLGDPARLGL